MATKEQRLENLFDEEKSRKAKQAFAAKEAEAYSKWLEAQEYNVERNEWSWKASGKPVRTKFNFSGSAGGAPVPAVPPSPVLAIPSEFMPAESSIPGRPPTEVGRPEGGPIPNIIRSMEHEQMQDEANRAFKRRVNRGAYQERASGIGLRSHARRIKSKTFNDPGSLPGSDI
jgi:hypothetical protein